MTSLGDLVNARVGILIHARWTSMISTFHRISDGLIYVDVKLNEWNYRVILVYIPHASYSVCEFNICFDNLCKCVLERQSNGRKFVVGGDFNKVKVKVKVKVKAEGPIEPESAVRKRTRVNTQLYYIRPIW